MFPVQVLASAIKRPVLFDGVWVLYVGVHETGNEVRRKAFRNRNDAIFDLLRVSRIRIQLQGFFPASYTHGIYLRLMLRQPILLGHTATELGHARASADSRQS